MTSLENRYWAKVVQGSNPDDCWGWIGTCSNFGHARIKFKGKQSTGHRLSWEIHNGEIPEGMNILHSCDNPPCTNPRHLRIGTQKDNMQDAFSRDRKGKLTLNQRRQILEEYESGASTRQLAAKWGVGKTAIWNTVAGKLSFDYKESPVAFD